MKIILSKKGYDDEFGGKPSIILPNNRMISFPIPVKNQIGVNTKDITINGEKLENYFISLDLETNLVHHIDPVIQNYGQNYTYGAFGQSSKAAIHLRNQKVSNNDLFLFYGTFCKTNSLNVHSIKYEPMHPFHCIWGYLVVDEIVDVNKINTSYYKELMDHPHYLNKADKQFTDNVIYVGKQYGSFTYSEKLRLTKSGYKKTYWSLPECFINTNMSWNGKNKFINVDGRAEMKVFGKGQEFVINATESIREWALDLISDS